MEAALSEVFTIAGDILADAPGVLTIVDDAVAAYRANDQAGLVAANASARALANSLAPKT